MKTNPITARPILELELLKLKLRCGKTASLKTKEEIRRMEPFRRSPLSSVEYVIYELVVRLLNGKMIIKKK